MSEDGHAERRDFKPGTKAVVVRCMRHDIEKTISHQVACDCPYKGAVVVVRGVRTDTVLWDIVLEDSDGDPGSPAAYSHKQLLILE